MSGRPLAELRDVTIRGVNTAEKMSPPSNANWRLQEW